MDASARREDVRADLVAGLSIAGLLLPEAVAYSGIANLPPQAGVIALFAGLIGYGLIGRSRFAIVSATSSSAAVLLAATSSIAGPDVGLRLALSCGLILLVGVLLIAAGAMGLGAASNFIAKPVLRGFAFGLALIIILHQLPKIVGVHPQPGNIFGFVQDLAVHWRQWRLVGLLIAAGSLAALMVLARWRGLPAALLVIAAGIVLDLAGVTTRHGVPAVGPITLALNWPAVPHLSTADWMRLGELAFALALVLYAESYGSIRTFAIRHADPVSPNRDLVALGAANLASALFQGMPVGAGFSATSANEAAGARSRRAAWIAAGVVLALVLLVLPWIEHTPEPVLAAIVVHAVGHTLDPSAMRQYFMWRRDRLILLAAVATVLVFGVLHGLLVAIGASLLLTLRDLSQPRVAWLGRLGTSHDYIDCERHPEAKPLPGLLIARPESPLFFANAERIFAAIRRRIQAGNAPAALIVSLEDSPDLDGTSVEALRDFAQFVRASGVALLLARVKDPVREVLRRAALADLPEACFSFWSVSDAVHQAQRDTEKFIADGFSHPD